MATVAEITIITPPAESTVKMTVREFYDFRNIAIQNNQQFAVDWSKANGVEVKCDTPFLIRFGYQDLLEF